MRYPLILLTFLVTLHCSAQQDTASATPSFRPTDTGSTVTFEIKNFGINTKGSFSGLQGKIVFNPAELAAASFDVSIDAATINTDNDMRDGHLKKESYFDVADYPRIRFVSTKIEAAGKGRYRVTGNLTIKKTTREISFLFTATPMGGDYIFNGQFTINRRDYEVGGASTISNGLTVFLTVLARRE